MILQYQALKVLVESTDAAALGWLREFLTPSFTVIDGGPSDCTVELVADARAYSELFGRGRSESTELDCFVLDSRVVRLPFWRSTPEERVAFDAPNRVFYRVAADGTVVTILTAAQNLAARFALMRVVREMAMTSARTRGALLLHGAAMSTPAGAIAIAGPKRAGKSTVLLHALRATGGCFISNDRVVVELGSGETLLRGMPTLATLRGPTLAAVPELRESVLHSGFDHRLALGESAPSGARTATLKPDGPVDLSPAQFCSLLGVRACGHGALRAILFPLVSASARGIEVGALSAAAASERLQSALFGTKHGEHGGTENTERGSSKTSPELFAPIPTENGAQDSARLCLRLSQSVPAFEWRLGPDAYADEKTLARLVGGLVANDA